MLSGDDVLDCISMTRQKYLKMHTSAINQGKGSDKRWTTRVPDKSKPDGRRVIRKPTKEEIENEVIKFYMEQETSTDKARISTAIALSALFPLWIEYASKRPKIASETLRKYRNDYKRFIADSEFGKMKVREIDYIDIEEFLIAEIQRLNLKKKALGNLFGYLKSVCYPMQKLPRFCIRSIGTKQSIPCIWQTMLSRSVRYPPKTDLYPTVSKKFRGKRKAESQ